MSRDDLGRIGVLMGGTSSEREISLRSGQAIYDALKEEGCPVVAFDIDTEDEDRLLHLLRSASIDLVFIALHGHFGEDGTLQAILEKAGVSYTGSGAQASRLAFNKVLSQEIFEKNGLRVPPHVIADKNKDDIDELLKKITFPVFVKPACEGSSIGISCATDKETLRKALEIAWRYGEQVLIEKAIKGREITAGILEKQALPLVEIRPKNFYFDFHAKYQKDQSDYIIPAQLSEEVTAELQQTALQAFQLLGCRHLGRIDIMLDENERYHILEVNTIPGFTATSLLPKAAKAAGLNFNQLCLKIARLSYGEKKKISGTSQCC